LAISRRRDDLLSPPHATRAKDAAGAAAATAGQRAAAATAGITPRAFVIGTLLIPLMCYWVEYTEIVAQGTDLAAMSLIIGRSSRCSCWCASTA
jgi:hypothetical protein